MKITVAETVVREVNVGPLQFSRGLMFSQPAHSRLLHCFLFSKEGAQ